MSNTANLGVPYVVAAQSQPEVTVNGAFDDFDGALGSRLAHTMSDANYTLNLSAVPNEALAYLAYVFTGTLTATRNIIVPANKKLYFVVNNTTGGHSLLVKTSGGTGVTIPNAASPYTICYCDGTNVVGVGAASLAGDSDVSFTSVANGDVVTYNSGSGKWVNSPSSSATLAGDTDVLISSPANNDVLTYETSSTKWKNKPASGGGGGATSPSGTMYGYGPPNDVTSGIPSAANGNSYSWYGATSGNAPIVLSFKSVGSQPPCYRASTTASTPTSQSWMGANSAQTLTLNTLQQLQHSFSLQQITSVRVWCGISSISPSGLKTATPSGNILGFRFDAAVDAHWQAVAANGGSQTTTATTIVPDTAMHQYRIAADGSGGWNFYIDGTLAANIPTGSGGLPTSTQQMGDLISIDADGVTGAAVTLELQGMQYWTKW